MRNGTPIIMTVVVGMMKTTTRITATIAATILVLPYVAAAQQDDQVALYVAVDCMKSTAAEYTSVETDIWQPMHEELVKQGKRNSWALYSVMYGDRSRCDYYTVTTYRGQEQLDANPDYVEVFEAVHPRKDAARAMARTWASREHVATELWQLVDSTEFKPHRFAIVNLMQADDPDAYELMESKVFKAAHQALVDSGHRSGWAVYGLVSPRGSAVGYNYSTVDRINNLAPVPMAEAMMIANPDRDLSAMHELLELRDHVRSETWALVTSTTRPAEE